MTWNSGITIDWQSSNGFTFRCLDFCSLFSFWQNHWVHV